MIKLFSEALKIRTLFGVAIFGLILVYLFKDTIHRFSGNESALALFLGFLFFMVIGILAIAAYYAMARQEVEKGSVTVRGSKKVDTTLRGGGSVEVRDSEEVKTNIDNTGSAPGSEKKT